MGGKWGEGSRKEMAVDGGQPLSLLHDENAAIKVCLVCNITLFFCPCVRAWLCVLPNGDCVCKHTHAHMLTHVRASLSLSLPPSFPPSLPPSLPHAPTCGRARAGVSTTMLLQAEREAETYPTFQDMLNYLSTEDMISARRSHVAGVCGERRGAGLGGMAAGEAGRERRE